MYYKCVRCNLVCKQKGHIVKHYNNKQICAVKDITIPDYNDIEKMRNLSLIPQYDDEDIKEHSCKTCNKTFCNKFNLDRHVKSSCKKDNIIENIKDSKLNLVNGDNNTCLIDCPINNYNINITLNGFDEKWSLDHISNDRLKLILIDYQMYEKLFEEIMKNINNINIILEDNNGTVYLKENKENQIKNKEQLLLDIVTKLKTQLKELAEIQKKNNMTLQHINATNLVIQLIYMQYIQKDSIFNNINDVIEKIIASKNDIAKINLNV